MSRELFKVKKKLHIDINNVVLEYRTTDAVPGIYHKGIRLGNIGYLDDTARETFCWNKNIERQDGVFKVSVLGPTIWDCTAGMVAVQGNSYAMLDIDAQRSLQRVSNHNWILGSYFKPVVLFFVLLAYTLLLIALKEPIRKFMESL